MTGGEGSSSGATIKGDDRDGGGGRELVQCSRGYGYATIVIR